MQSRDFCFWLQGLMEIAQPETLNTEQVSLIKAHLALVFQHDANIKRAEMAHPTLVPNSQTAAMTPNYLQSVQGLPSTAIAYC